MFDSIGWGEIAVLTLAAVFILGLERLPSLAEDASKSSRVVKDLLTGMQGGARRRPRGGTGHPR